MNWLKSPSQRFLKITACLMLAGVVAGMGWCVNEIRFLNTHYSMNQFMPKDHPLYVSDRLIKKTFRLTDQEPIIVNLQLPDSAKGTWLEQSRVDVVDRAGKAMAKIEGIQKLTSIANLESADDSSGSIQVSRLLGNVPEKNWKRRVLKDPLLAPGLISKDGRVVTLVGAIGILTEHEVHSITDQIKELVGKEIATTGAKLTVSGVIPLQNQMTTLMSQELINFFGLAFLVCLITLLLYFRSFSSVIMCLILVLIANITTLAALAILGIPFSVLSSALPIICSIEALAIGSHTLLIFGDNYRQAMLQPNPPKKSDVMFSTYRALIGPNFLMSTTTIIGFASLVLSTVPLIKQFAISVSSGILLSCVVMSIALPPMMILFPIPVARRWTGAKARWALWVIHHRRIVVLLAAASVAIFVIKGLQLNWAVQLYDDLPKSDGIKSSADLIDRKLGGMIPLEVMITKNGEEAPWNEPTRIANLGKILKRWRRDPAVGSGIGLSDLLNTGIQKLDSRKAVAETLFLYGFSGADNPTTNFLSGDGNSTRLMFRMKDVPADQMNSTIQRIVKDINRAFPGFDVKTGGMAAMVHPLNAELSTDLIYGLWHSLLLISVVLVLVFRSFRLAFVAAVPNLLPPVTLLATMTYLKTPVKPVVAIIFSIALGLAYNNTVFLLTRLKKIQQRFVHATDIIGRTWYQEGNPCLFSSLAVLGGFGVFLASYFSPNRTFGAYMLWSIGVGLIGDLVVLPALLRMFPWFIFPSNAQRAAAATGKGWIRNLIILLALLAAMGPKAAAAPQPFDVVHTPFVLSMNQQAFSNVIFEGAISKAMSGSSVTDLPDIVVADPFTVRVSGIHAKFSYLFDAPANQQKQGEWQLLSRQLTAEILVDSIEAHDVIKVKQGGTEVEIRLDGSCRNVRLVLPDGSASASGLLQLGQRNGAPRLELKNFGAKWIPGSWKVASMECTSPAEGFGQRVELAASERLRQIEPFFAPIQDALQAGLDNSLNGPVAIVLGNPFQAKQTVRLNGPPARANATGDVVVRGDAYFYFNPGKGGCGADIKSFEAEPQLKAKDSSLTIPFSAVKALFGCVHSDGSLAFDTDSTKFKGFRALMDSYFKKQAVWPDLNHFDSNALFRFHGVSQSAPVLTSEKATGQNSFQVRVQQKMAVDMKAPISGKSVPYMTVSTFFAGPVSVNVAGGKVRISPSSEDQLAMGGRFDPAYVRTYNPNQKVDWSRITPEAQKALLEEGWSFDMPSYGVSKLVTLAARDGSLQGPNYRIGFDVVKSAAPRKP